MQRKCGKSELSPAGYDVFSITTTTHVLERLSWSYFTHLVLPFPLTVGSCSVRKELISATHTKQNSKRNGKHTLSAYRCGPIVLLHDSVKSDGSRRIAKFPCFTFSCNDMENIGNIRLIWKLKLYRFKIKATQLSRRTENPYRTSGNIRIALNSDVHWWLLKIHLHTCASLT